MLEKRILLVYYYLMKIFKTKNNLSAKIILMVEFILLISGFLFCSVSIYRARLGIRKAIWQRMLDIANCASGSVNGDMLQTLEKEDVGSDKYNDLYKTLAVFRDNAELEYIYSIKEESPGNFVFTLDTDPVSPAAYGDSIETTDALSRASKGTAAVDAVPYSDAWGQFYSAYSPVFDSSGKVAGIIAVDFSAEWFEDQLSAQTRSTVFSYLIIMLITLSVAAILALLTVSPFVQMQEELIGEKIHAESANRAKSEFLANMSHEIRTPINAVLGMNEMIIREEQRVSSSGAKDEDTAKDALKNIGSYAADVKRAGNNLLAIVNNILDFSKIEEGRMDIVDAPYQLCSLLHDLNNMVIFRAKDKGLDFLIEADKDIPNDLCGDEVRIRQILMNILVNAVKYTEKGCVRMTLEGEKKSGRILMLKIRVSDTGIGIKKEDIDKLFTKFERLEMERNGTIEGTGLGLAITKRLLEAMGGNVSVYSEYGKGSVFTVTLPQKILSDTPLGDFKERFDTKPDETEAYKESFRAPTAHILIVDDTNTNLVVVTNFLKNTKMQMDTATSGADAVAMASKTKYDVILMDQMMPGMNGSEALRHIREDADSASRNTPVICLTADAVIGAREHYMEEGYSDYMTKPVDSNALEALMMKYLPESKTERVHEKI